MKKKIKVGDIIRFTTPFCDHIHMGRVFERDKLTLTVDLRNYPNEGRAFFGPMVGLLDELDVDIENVIEIVGVEKNSPEEKEEEKILKNSKFI